MKRFTLTTGRGLLTVLASIGLFLAAGMGCPLGLVVDAGADGTVTIGQSIVLQGSSTGGSAPLTIVWSPEEGLSNAGILQPTFTPTMVGDTTFTLTVTDANGVSASDTVTVTADTNNDPVNANAGTDTNAAVGQAVQLSGSATGGDGSYTFAWSPTTGLSNANIANPTFTPAATGATTFTLTVTDGEGVTDTDTVVVTALDATGLTSLTWGADQADAYQVVAVFDHDLDETTAETVSNYRINGTTTSPTTAALGTDNRTVTLTFNQPLSTSSTFDISVGGGVLDTNGNAVVELLGQAANSNGSDSTNPGTVSRTWGANFSGSYQVLLIFNEVLSEDTAESTSAYRITGTSTNPISATLGNDGRTVTLVFDSVALSTANRVDISVSSTITDINGNAMAQALNQTISANAADTTAPTIAMIRHASNFNAAGYQVSVEFNEAMDETTCETATSYRIGGTNPTSAALSTDGRTVVLTFQTPLAITDKLDVSVGSAIKDINGQTLSVQANQTINANTNDAILPVVGTIAWEANSTSGYQIAIQFSESMDETSAVKVTNYRINGTATPPTAASLSNTGKIVTLTFSTLALDTANTLDLSLSNSIVDINGNAVAERLAQTINANAEVNAPTISSVTHGSEQTSYTVIITFNEVMDETTTENGAFYDINNGDNAGPGSIVLAADGRTATLTWTTTQLTQPFAIADTIDISIGSGVRDINGNALVAAPATAIAANANDVAGPANPVVTHTAAATTVTLVFDEVMDEATVEAAAYTTDKGGVNLTGAVLADDGLTVTVTFDADPGDGGGGQNITVPGTIRDINNQAYAGAVLTIPN